MTKEKINDLGEVFDPAEQIRSAITLMVASRLAAQKALMQLKEDAEMQKLVYDNAIEELESAIEQIYSVETSLGDAHQYTIVGIATESVTL